ncbi:hypothetical protein D3C72_1621870 [compost metagenome]
MHDVFAGFGMTAINKGMIEPFGNAVGDAAGDRPGTHHRIESGFVLQPGAQCGGHHVKQPANHRRSRQQPGRGGSSSVDAPGDFGGTDDRWQRGHDVANPQQLRQRRVIAAVGHLIKIGFGDIGLFAGQLAGQAVAQIIVRHQNAANLAIAFRLVLPDPAQQ